VVLDRTSLMLASLYLDPNLQKVGMLVEAAYSMGCEIAYVVDFHDFVLFKVAYHG